MSTTEKFTDIVLKESDYPIFIDVPSPIIEYNFSWDEIGMKLSDLWNTFELAFCEKKAVDCQDELYDFLDLFIDTYKEWKPTEVADKNFYDTEQRNATGMYKHCIPETADKSVGHPFRFIRGFTNWIKCMLPEQQSIQDIHRVETAFEILSRSPHNRVLLRYVQFHTVIYQVLSQCSYILSSMVTGNSDCYESLMNILRILNNFLPTLDHCKWLTLQSPFESNPTNVLQQLNSVFGSLNCLSLEGHNECVLDVSYELVVCVAKLYELLRYKVMDKKWVVLLHHLILIAAGNVAISSNPHRCDMVLNLAYRIAQNLGSYLLGENPVNQLSDAEMTSLNVDVLLLLLNASDVSDNTRSKAFQLGCYEIANTISFAFIPCFLTPLLHQYVARRSA